MQTWTDEQLLEHLEAWDAFIQKGKSLSELPFHARPSLETGTLSILVCNKEDIQLTHQQLITLNRWLFHQWLHITRQKDK